MSKRAREDEPSPTSHGMMSPIQHLATSVELISRRQEQAATQISSLQRQVATLNCRLTASGQQPPRLWPPGRLSAGNPSNTVQALGETQSQAFPETQVLSPAFPETQVSPQAQASPTAGDASAEDVLHHPSRTAEVHAEVQPALDSQVDEESQVQQFGAPPVPISALTPETFGAQLATSKDKGKTWQGDDRVAGEYQGPIPRTPTVKETCDKLFDNKDNWYKGRHKSDPAPTAKVQAAAAVQHPAPCPFVQVIETFDVDTMPEMVDDTMSGIPYGNEAQSTRKIERQATAATVAEDSDDDASSHTNLSDFTNKRTSCSQLEQLDGQSPPPF